MSASALVTVGNELLAGRIVDSNAAWVSRELRLAGFPVVHRETVTDDEHAIAASVKRCLLLAKVVVVSGGLGPTADDVTREGLARALSVPLVKDQAATRQLEEFFARCGRTLRERDLPQTFVPEGGMPLLNERGTAPGILFEREDRLLTAYPGVPSELKAMVTTHLLPRLLSRTDRGPTPHVAEVTVSGVGEAVLSERITDLMRPGRNPQFGSYPRGADVVLQLEAIHSDPAEAQRLIEADLATLRERLGVDLVAERRCDLNEVVAAMLLERGLKVSVAESLTGGMVAAQLIAIPGMSAALDVAWTTYSNDAKIRELSVDPQVIAEHGAVSEQCARQMAEGARRRSGADLAVSTTGIAGPTGAVDGKPVGTVWFAVATATRTRAIRRQVPGSRDQVRERATHLALDLLRREVLAMDGGRKAV